MFNFLFIRIFLIKAVRQQKAQAGIGKFLLLRHRLSGRRNIAGLIAKSITVALLPMYLLAILALMAVTHELLLKNARGGNE